MTFPLSSNDTVKTKPQIKTISSVPTLAALLCSKLAQVPGPAGGGGKLHKPLPGLLQPCLSHDPCWLFHDLLASPTRAKTQPCSALLQPLAVTPAVGSRARARSTPLGPMGWVPWPSGAGPPCHIPFESVSANNPLLTALFYYLTAQFFLQFYGISLKPPEGDTAPFPEVK